MVSGVSNLNYRAFITMPRSAQSQYRIIESLEDLPLRLGQFGYDVAVLARAQRDPGR